MNNWQFIFKIKKIIKPFFYEINNSFSLHYSCLLWWSIIFLLFILAAIRPIGIDHDSEPYINVIQQCIETNFSSMDFTQFEPLFYFIIFVSNLLFHDAVRGVFIIYAFFALLIKAVAIQKILGRSFLSLYVYVCLFYFLHEFTQIRAAVAISIFLLSLPDIINRKLLAFYCKVLFAIFFHYSALLMIPLYFFNKRSNIFYYLPAVAIVCTLLIPYSMFTDYLIYIVNIAPNILKTKLMTYLYHHEAITTENKIHLFKLLFVEKFFLSFLIFYYAIFFMEKTKILYMLDNKGILLSNILSIAITIYFFFFRFRVLALRPSEFLFSILIILIPYISGQFINKEYRKIFTIFMVTVCGAILIGDRLYYSHLVHFEILLK